MIRLRRSAGMPIASRYMLQSDVTSDGTSEEFFDGLMDRPIGSGPEILEFGFGAANPIGVT